VGFLVEICSEPRLQTDIVWSMTFLHALESRALLALSVGIDGQTLLVTGTDAGDHISVTQAKGVLTVSIHPASFSVPAKGLKGITVRAGLGDDKVAIWDTVTLKTTLAGGEGNDHLRAGRKPSKLSGDVGHDTLSGGNARDTFVGGPGTDTIDYSLRLEPLIVSLDGIANDGSVAGGGKKAEKDNVAADIENVTGGAGSDTLVGSPGRNTLKGGPGNDSLVGDAGDDLLVGGAGADRLNGGDGDDILLAIDSTASDVLDGGLGFDSAAYDLIVGTPDVLANVEDAASVLTL
jgi:Ca2+-binding RTX toxin-like protein